MAFLDRRLPPLVRVFSKSQPQQKTKTLTSAPYRHTKSIFQTIFGDFNDHFAKLHSDFSPAKGKAKKDKNGKEIGYSYTVTGLRGVDGLATGESLKIEIEKDGSVSLQRYQHLTTRPIWSLGSKKHDQMRLVLNEEISAKPSGGVNSDFQHLCYTLCTAMQRMYGCNMNIAETTLDRGAVMRDIVFGADPVGAFATFGKWQPSHKVS